MFYYETLPRKLPKNSKRRQRRLEREMTEIDLLLDYLQHLISELDAAE